MTEKASRLNKKILSTLEDAEETAADLLNQFAVPSDDGLRIYHGGLSALETAFEYFGLDNGCTRQEMWDTVKRRRREREAA